jgi:hypothetical protein
MSNEIDELKAQVAALKAEVEALKPRRSTPTKPQGPYDANIRFGMPPSAIEAMTSVVDDRLMRSIVADHVGKPTSLPGPGPGPKPIPSERGWVNPRPLKSGPQY